jgi:hypothetical protein
MIDVVMVVNCNYQSRVNLLHPLKITDKNPIRRQLRM